MIERQNCASRSRLRCRSSRQRRSIWVSQFGDELQVVVIIRKSTDKPEKRALHVLPSHGRDFIVGQFLPAKTFGYFLLSRRVVGAHGNAVDFCKRTTAWQYHKVAFLAVESKSRRKTLQVNIPLRSPRKFSRFDTWHTFMSKVTAEPKFVWNISRTRSSSKSLDVYL